MVSSDTLCRQYGSLCPTPSAEKQRRNLDSRHVPKTGADKGAKCPGTPFHKYRGNIITIKRSKHIINVMRPKVNEFSVNVMKKILSGTVQFPVSKNQPLGVITGPKPQSQARTVVEYRIHAYGYGIVRGTETMDRDRR